MSQKWFSCIIYLPALLVFWLADHLTHNRLLTGWFSVVTANCMALKKYLLELHSFIFGIISFPYYCLFNRCFAPFSISLIYYGIYHQYVYKNITVLTDYQHGFLCWFMFCLLNFRFICVVFRCGLPRGQGTAQQAMTRLWRFSRTVRVWAVISRFIYKTTTHTLHFWWYHDGCNPD